MEESVRSLRAMGLGSGLNDAAISQILIDNDNNVDSAIDALFAMSVQEQEREEAAAAAAAAAAEQPPSGFRMHQQQPVLEQVRGAAPAPAAPDGVDDEEEIDELTRMLLGMDPLPPKPPVPTQPLQQVQLPHVAQSTVSLVSMSAAAGKSDDGFSMVSNRRENRGSGGRGSSFANTVRLVIMVGPPGCGKSTTSSKFRDAGWIVVSQDELGNRKDCEAAVYQALSAQQRVVVDRTNIDQAQRAHWVGIARSLRMAENSIVALAFSVPIKECKNRVMSRRNHRSLPAAQESLQVIDRFFSLYAMPMASEGFGMVVAVKDYQDPRVAMLVDGVLPASV